MFGKTEELALVMAKERSELKCFDVEKVDKWCRTEYRGKKHDG